MFSDKDRATISHIRNLFSRDDTPPEYREKSNMLILRMAGRDEEHLFCVTCIGDVLRISTVKNIPVNDCSNEILKYVLDLNLSITLGGFCYVYEKQGFVYKMGIPLFEMPSKEMVLTFLDYSVNVLDHYLPEIFFIAGNNNIAPNKQREPTYH